MYPLAYEYVYNYCSYALTKLTKISTTATSTTIFLFISKTTTLSHFPPKLVSGVLSAYQTTQKNMNTNHLQEVRKRENQKK